MISYSLRAASSLYSPFALPSEGRAPNPVTSRKGVVFMKRLVLWLLFGALVFTPLSPVSAKRSGTRNSPKRYCIKVKLKYSRDTLFTYTKTITRFRYRRLQFAKRRDLEPFVVEARKALLRKKRAYTAMDYMVAGWEKTVYTTLEKVSIKDKYFGKTTKIWEK